MVVPTAPYIPHHPWQVEWNRGSNLRCHIGIISDIEALENEEWKPRRFPEKAHMSIVVNQQGMTNRAFAQNKVRMASKAFTTGAKSGSALLRKNVDGFGRCDQNNSEPLDEEKGYVEWAESDLIGTNHPDSIYLILHRSGLYWYISWVAQADLEDSDIRIAVIKKNGEGGLRTWQLFQLWKSDIGGGIDRTEEQFQVTHFLGDLFKVNGGFCSFNQHFTHLQADASGNITGDRSYLVYMPYGEVSRGTIEITKPVVWGGSIPKSDPFTSPTTPPANPTFEDSYFFCDHTVSAEWSVILGHTVPSMHLPCIYIVPRSFAQTNLKIENWEPSYSFVFKIPTYEELYTSYGYDGYEGNTTSGFQYSLGGDLIDGYYLTEPQPWPLPSHRHSVPYFSSLQDLKAVWSKVGFRGKVIAHLDWSSESESWTIKQYHKGNAYIPNGEAKWEYKINQYPDQFNEVENPPYYFFTEFNWSTSFRVAKNLGDINSAANLMWQDCNHESNNSNRLIKY